MMEIPWDGYPERNVSSNITTPNASKVEIALISLEGDVIQWFDWLVVCCGSPTWDEFEEGLLV
jgi:hypothetical protein